MTHTLLQIDSSMRHAGSVTRDLTALIADRLGADHVIHRDLADTPIPQIDEAWIGANFTAADERTDAQAANLAMSDTLVAELQAADTVVIGVPIYNFGVSAALKAWVDQVARAGLTFRYTEGGPQGLLTGKRAIIAVASGGTEAGSEIDFATGYVRHVLGFIGITDVTTVAADRMMLDGDTALNRAHQAVDALGKAA